MKLLLLTENFPPRVGGTPRWFWEIYHRMPRDEVAVVAGDCAGAEEFDKKQVLTPTRIPLTWTDWGFFGAAGLRNYLGAARAVRAVARRERAEQIHCGRVLPEGWIAWLLRRWCGLPYGCYVLGEELSYAHQSRQLAYMMKRVFAEASYLIACSHNSARLMKENWGYPAERIHLLHPGVDVERFTPAEPDESIRKRLGWRDRTVVLTVGRLQARKGHDRLIRAMVDIRKRVENALYAIAGEGEERPALERLVAENGLSEHVQFLGEIDDAELVRCYQQCDLFVLPNRDIDGDVEGFGMVLVEAQACGKPVIGGASGGTADTMKIPETGRLVCCDEWEALAREVSELLCDAPLRAAMGQAARHWAVEQFSWDSLSRKAQELFRRTTEGPRTR